MTIIDTSRNIIPRYINITFYGPDIPICNILYTGRYTLCYMYLGIYNIIFDAAAASVRTVVCFRANHDADVYILYHIRICNIIVYYIYVGIRTRVEK